MKDFSQVNLVANTDQYSAARVDPALLNAWGLAFSSTGTAWVNSTGGHLSAVYDKDGAFIAARPAVYIPSPAAHSGGSPTGIVFSASATDFLLANSKPARFIFVGVDGVLSAWNAGDTAQLIKNNSAGSAYTGLALATSAGASYLYAADFRAGKIEVWNSYFAPVSMPFKDSHLPAGFAPFNIQAIGTSLYVTYAKVGPDGRDQPGPGNGYVDIFNTNGSLVSRFAARGTLTSPWGIAQAPASFFNDDADNHDLGDNNGVDNNNNHNNSGPGKNGEGNNGNSGSNNSGKGNGDGNDNNGNGSGISNNSSDESILLVGNFGDGRINAYRQNGNFLGQLKSHGFPVTIYGLWSLVFPPVTATTIDPNRLYFTAGPNQEKDGLFGYLIKK